MYFVNFSNHPSESWNEQQKTEAEKWGEIVDVPFPNVQPEASCEEIRNMAESCVEKIQEYYPTAVMCQGEFTLTYWVVKLLKERKITVVSACSKRQVTEENRENGVTCKKSVFKFVQFREY